jgi:hypothetical protein
MEMYLQESLFDVECMSYCREVAQDKVRNEANFDNDAVVKSEGGVAGPRKVYTLEEVDDKIRNLTRPPPMCDESYFRDVCGLHNKSTNPHRLQVKNTSRSPACTDYLVRGMGGLDSNTPTAKMQT